VNAPSEATSAIAYRVAWDPSANATEYRVEEATDSSFSNATITTVPAPAAETQFTHVVTANTTYFYRVAARNISGSCNVTSAFSPAVAVIVKTPPPPPTFLRVIAAAASTAGNFGSFFRTSAQLYNPGTSNLKGKLIYHSAGVSGSDNDPSLSYDIPPSATLYFADIVSSMKQSGLGSIDIISNSSFPVAIFRVFNDGGATGTTGMVEEMLRPEEALTEGESAVLIGPPDPVAARLNIGVRTLASGATLSVTQKTKDGATVKTLTKSYTGTYFNQTTDALFLEQTQGLAASDILIIKVTSGSAFIYGATTDNKTQDPSLQVGRKMN
jgi:hypothetical protein